MEWSVQKNNPWEVAVDLLVLTVFVQQERPVWPDLPAPLMDFLHESAGKDKDGGFTAEAGSLLLLPAQGIAATWVLLVGLGSREEVSLNRVRRAAGAAAKKARDLKAGLCGLGISSVAGSGYDRRTIARCWVEGAEMALSEMGELKSNQSREKTPKPSAWILIEEDGRKLRRVDRGIGEGLAYSAGCLLARNLVNLPANYLTPVELAARARRLARAEGLRCKVLGPAQLAKAKMGGLLGVAQGSEQEPRLIVLESAEVRQKSRRRRRRIALVGKGVTFDAGGISLKPPPKMDQMKSDMSGAAAVLGAALTIQRLAKPVDLLVVIPAVENLPDGRAVKPGDVLTMASGKTVEVLNTDAEGRLILADALHYACGRQPDYVIDAATLTGACALALGRHFAGLLSNSAELIEALTQAGGETFERVWHLPLTREHHQAIEGQVADICNLGPREGGALTAAAFLAEFVAEEIPWAHLDIAGTVWTDKPGPLGPKGATGFGSRLLARTVEILVS
jgi:leucyl aminopeptidase